MPGDEAEQRRRSECSIAPLALKDLAECGFGSSVGGGRGDGLARVGSPSSCRGAAGERGTRVSTFAGALADHGARRSPGPGSGGALPRGRVGVHIPGGKAKGASHRAAACLAMMLWAEVQHLISERL